MNELRLWGRLRMVQRQSTPYVLMLPALLILVGIAFYPIYYAVDFSFYRTRYFQKLEFVGFKNYLDLAGNPDFSQGLISSLEYTIGSLILTIPMGLLFASLLNRPIRFRTTFRTILFIPWTLSQSVAGMLWLWVLNPSLGPVKYVLSEMGIENVVFLANPDWAIWILVFVNAWMSYPLATVLLLAALQTVPNELYEAAKIDGCNAWSSFWFMTIPSIKSTLMTTAIMLTLQFFNMVTLIYVMTGGGPLGLTRTLTLLVFLDGFFNFRLAAAATVGMILFLLNIIFSLAYIRVLRQSST